GVMAGAILGALHGESVIQAADRATLDSANRFDLTAAADRFAELAMKIMARDEEAARARARHRNALIDPPPPPAFGRPLALFTSPSGGEVAALAAGEGALPHDMNSRKTAMLTTTEIFDSIYAGFLGKA